MILSFIEINDIKSLKFPEPDSLMGEIYEESEGISADKNTQDPAKDLSSESKEEIPSENAEEEPENPQLLNSSSQLFIDTFELRYLQHKEKIEKERFARELLADGQ